MSKMITVLLAQGATMTPVTLTVNGKSVTIPNNVETDIPAFYEDAARNCGFDIQILGETEAEDAPVDGSPGPEDDGAAGGGGGNAPTGDPDTGRAPLGEPGHSDDHLPNSDGAGDAFNADAVIDGKVEDVAGRLAALTPEQLEAVTAAEKDREQPRKGVLAAIKAAKAAAAPAE